MHFQIRFKLGQIRKEQKKIFNIALQFTLFKLNNFVIVSRHPDHWFHETEINFKKDIKDPRFRIIDHVIRNYFTFSAKN